MSRRSILRSLRRGEGGPRSGPGASASPLPSPDGPWQRFDDPRGRFEALLAAAGGESAVAVDDEALVSLVGSRIRETSARRIWVDPAIGVRKTDWGAGVVAFAAADLAATPVAAALELVVLSADFAVAENGAVWVDAAGWPHPAVHALCEHLVLVVPSGAWVHTLHEAYERLDLSSPGFGVFLAGPSKTADIEQALVIGAHGPRSLWVVWRGGED